MKHDFSATWFAPNVAEAASSRIVVAFDNDGRANVLVDGQTGQAVHLVLKSTNDEAIEEIAIGEMDEGTQPFAASPIVDGTVATTFPTPSLDLSSTPLTVLSFLSLLLLASLGAIAATQGLRSVISF